MLGRTSRVGRNWTRRRPESGNQLESGVPFGLHAIATAILNNNFGLKPSDYAIAPGNEAQLAQFLSQKEIDAGVLRSVTLAQIDEIKPRRLASVVDEWKKLTKRDAPPILAVTIVYNNYLANNQESVAKFIAATREALQFGSKNKGRVAETLQKAANMDAFDRKYVVSLALRQ